MRRPLTSQGAKTVHGSHAPHATGSEAKAPGSSRTMRARRRDCWLFPASQARRAGFGDGNGGFYDTADDAPRLLYRPQDPADNATPSGWFAMANVLLSYGALTGSWRYREAAGAALSLIPALAGRFPRAAGCGMSAGEASLSGPAEIAIVGETDDPRTARLHRTAIPAAPPGAVIAVGPADGAAAIPLLAGRGLADGAPAAYVCRNFTCRAPVTTPEELQSLLAGSSST